LLEYSLRGILAIRQQNLLLAGGLVGNDFLRNHLTISVDPFFKLNIF
jgi:hypothetical protein